MYPHRLKTLRMTPNVDQLNTWSEHCTPLMEDDALLVDTPNDVDHIIHIEGVA
ncbi:hypothetical protein D3C77_720490 [compost metagenome]